MTRAAARRPRRPLFSILDLWARPISFLPILGRIPGSDAVAALWMSHALERQRQAGEGAPWICPAAEWYDATLLGRKEQERARRFWDGLGIIADRRAGGVAAPGNALAYVVDVRALDALVRSHLEEGPRPAPRGVPKSPKRALRKRPEGTVPEMSQTDTSTIIPVVLPTEETGKESERGVQGGGQCSSERPTAEEWATYCRTTWTTWSADDIARAYHSAAAAGWRKSRGGRIRDWKAFAAVCAKVWETSREGQEAAKRAKDRAAEEARRAEGARTLQAARTAGASLTAEQREENRRALMSGLFGQRAAA